MKAFWRIYDKPRGRWRPLLEWGLHLSPEEEEKIKELNINTTYRICIISSTEQKMCQKRAAILFPGPVLEERSKKVGTGSFLGSPYVMCDGCPFEGTDSYVHKREIDLTKDTIRVRVEWRPGPRPDYSDYIGPVREFLKWALEELQRRIEEAEASSPSEEWGLEESFDLYSVSSLQTSNEENSERKLRVIRR